MEGEKIICHLKTKMNITVGEIRLWLLEFRLKSGNRLNAMFSFRV